MKTSLFTTCLFAFTMLRANIDLDSLRKAAFHPIMENYLEEISILSKKISSSSNRDSIKHYAKLMMRMSDDMERKVKTYNNYRASSMVYGSGFFLTSAGYNYGFGFVNVQGNKVPEAVSSVNRIYDLATNIRFFCNGKPEKISRKLQKIEEERRTLSRY